MANSNNHWYFTKDQLENTPSKECGVEPSKELSYRQQAANFIQDMGQKLKVSQLCINTAIVYMHRFYVFHSFTRFPWNSIAAAALFLAAKVEEQPRKLEHVIRVVTPPKNPHDTSIDTTSERYITQAQDLVFNENILLQTLGFDVAIDHPHTHVVRCCHLVRASKDLAQTSYFMASNSLHLTTMCLQYKPTVVACFCIHFVCKWSNWEIPLSNEKKEWFSYVDETVTSELLEQLTKEFLFIYDRCSSRLKEKIMAIGDGLALAHNSGHSSSPFEPDKKFLSFHSMDQKDGHGHRPHHGDIKTLTMEDFKQRPLRYPHDAGSSSQHRDREREYREKKDRERLGHHSKPPPPPAAQSSKQGLFQHGHHSSSHAPGVDPKLSKHGRPQSVGSHPTNPRSEPRDILREATRDIGLPTVSNKETNNLQVRTNDKREYVQQRPEHNKLSINTADVNNPNSNSNSDNKHSDSSRSRPPMDSKQPIRRREDPKPQIKLESDIKKHLSAAIYEKNPFLNKSLNATSQPSQKVKSPFNADTSKSVPNPSTSQSASLTKTETKVLPLNGGSNVNVHNLPLIENDVVKVKPEFDDSISAVKKPSLFSPEKSPPTPKKCKTKTPPSSGKKSEESPELPEGNGKRNRTSSTNSEPELRPVIKKIDQVQVPDIITPIPEGKQEKMTIQGSIAKELKPPDLIPPFSSNASMMNGIETNPSLISSLLKETPPVPHLPSVIAANAALPEPSKEKEHHKEHKKNKKEKHKHKDKDKDRNRDEKEKKKKHKDKDKEKSKHKHEKHQTESESSSTQPIRITIPKDKIQPPESSAPNFNVKIKIPKDKIKTETISEPVAPAVRGSIKIKISKDVINSFSNNDTNSRKRGRESPTNGAPPNKVSKSNHNRPIDTKSAKNSYNKVSNSNVSEPAIHNVQQQMYNGINHMAHPSYTNQNYFYNYPPPSMQMPMMPPHSMTVHPPPPPPPPFMFQQYYAPPGYMYQSADLYAPPAVGGAGTNDALPPLPQDPPPPPNKPPPPPPDF
ncbi:cyclin-T isoform X2 [Photinus pyralis]|uniref:Cyclin-like domain-containing protein n=1 Tax=Photinus pyralis TaxID=7054 RepID=A0A1Y1N436_PHOPY|nr:cyclin-T isoform X2 [Photinus pyralis]